MICLSAVNTKIVDAAEMLNFMTCWPAEEDFLEKYYYFHLFHKHHFTLNRTSDINT